MNIDVLIVGAGPTGLMLANQLARRHVRTLIIDRHSGPAQQTRAMAVHARTLEIYSQLGIADRALALGRRGTGGNLWSEGQLRARIPLGDIGQDLSPFPFVLMLGQDANERLLGEHLREQGQVVHWNTELVSLQQQTGSVKATLRQPDGSLQIVTATFVAGCDGGRSSVRELNGIGFPGAPYEHVFFVADTEARGPMVPDELNIYLWRDGFHLFFPMHGTDRWRVIGILPPALRGDTSLTFETLAPTIRKEAGAALDFRRCDWFSTYRIQHRCTEKFRDRRCFLLGDAAHVHSPMGGQGMNTGLQDAYNLAWKLALVIHGHANDSLLDSYQQERKQVAERLLSTTDRAFRLLVSDHWLAGLFRTRVFTRVAALAMRRPRAQRTAFMTLSQIGIRYPDSPLSGSSGALPATAPRPGDRFPSTALAFRPDGAAEDLYGKLDDTRFTLLVLGQEGVTVPTLGGQVNVHVLPESLPNGRALVKLGIPACAWYLLRPDGHVATCGARFDVTAVHRWFDEAGIHLAMAPPGSPAVTRAAA
jgi:2-polyprenyl-6-methoxyphenol hydroxylase-like FAD-dependent oxidoreductase